MTPRERWMALFDGKKPDRVPTDFWSTPEVLERLICDLACENEDALWRKLEIDRPYTVDPVPTLEHHPDDPDADLFGLRYKAMAVAGGTYNEVVHHPLINAETVEDVDAYAWPEPDWYSCDTIPAQIDKADDRPVIAGHFEPFMLYCHMRGMEKSYEDLLLRPKVAESIFEHIFNVFYTVYTRMFEVAKGRIDIIYVAEDLGSQQTLLISPSLYRKFFKERQRKMIDLAKAHDTHIFYHTDGAARPLIPDLIEVGIEILNPLQWRCQGMELEGLARDFGDKLIFHGGVDNQDTLAFGTPDDVRNEVRRNLEIFKDCRYILAPCHNIQPLTPTENVLAMYETAHEYGQFA